ncbi:MAG: glycerol kinase GlpK [Bdellovibrionia bacterium]
MSAFIVAIDQGTTSSRTVIVNQKGQIVAEAQQAFRQIFPQPGWVEHDLEDVWFSTQTTLKKAIEKAAIKPHQILGIGITNQRETVGLWHSQTLKPVGNAIVWQCRRTQPLIEKLRKQKLENTIRKKTGLVLDPYFSGSKIQWMLKNYGAAKDLLKKGHLRAGTIDCFILNRLTAGEYHRTDVSNASRTMLMNIHSGWWDSDLLKIFQIKEDILPEITASAGQIGFTKGLGFLPDGIPITGIAGDQQAALFGQTCFSVGEAKCTFGTGSFMLLNTGNNAVTSKHKLLTTVAWKLPNQEITYALEGGAFICGAAVQWLRDGLGLIQHSSEIEKLASTVTSSEGVEFVPALTGMGAPYWMPEARGLITGLTRGTTKAHIARATLEAMALQNTEILLAMEKDAGKKIKMMKVDGGAAANNLLMQLQADYLGSPVIRPQVVETTAMGAAYLAGLGGGVWKDLAEIKKIWQQDKEFKNNFSAKQRQVRLQKWQDATGKL